MSTAEERMQNEIDELEQENRLLRARNDRLQAQAQMKIAEGIASGKVNTIVVPMDFKGMVNLK